MRLTAAITPIDLARVYRLLLAWAGGDQVALDLVLAEADAEPAGSAALVFALIEYSSRLTEETAPDWAERLGAWLLAHEGGGDPAA